MMGELDYLENEIILPSNLVLNGEPIEMDRWYWSRIKYF